jgi:hypothetical protein
MNVDDGQYKYVYNVRDPSLQPWAFPLKTSVVLITKTTMAWDIAINKSSTLQQASEIFY